MLLAGSMAIAADPLDKSLQLTDENNRQEQQTQKRIDAASDETRKMLEEYRLLSRELEALAVYNGQLERLVNSQAEEETSLAQQIVEVDHTQREVVPLMLRMLDGLDTFISADIPFLPAERRQRITQLRALMDRADVSVAEKYRRILEAWQIEMEYGRTIETYREDIEADAITRSVDILRVGRVGLYQQSLDGKLASYWHDDSGQWLPLAGQDRLAIRSAMRVARKQVAPELLRLQVSLPGNDQP